MSLADHWEDKTYFDAGVHTVKVVASRVFKFNSGNDGVEFTVQDDQGRSMRTGGFVLTDKSLWKLASFAAACGLKKDECRNYDPNLPACHNMLVGKTLNVVVGEGEPNLKDGKRYMEIQDWGPAGGNFQPRPTTPLSAKAPASVPDFNPAKPDAVPF